MSRAKTIGLAAVAALSLVSLSVAQTTKSMVVPAEYATKAGNSLTQDLGLDRIRSRCFVDGSLVQPLLKQTIKELRFRRDENENKYLNVTYEPMTRVPTRTTIPLPTWRVRIGYFSYNVLTASPYYDTGGNRPVMTTVYNSRLNFDSSQGPVAMPNLARPSTGLPGFDVKFPFTTPFMFPGPHLCFEHFSYNRASYAYRYYMDYVVQDSGSSRAGKVEMISTTSVGCPSGQNRVVGTCPNPGAGNLTMYLTGAEANKRAACLFGLSTTKWGGANLPMDLAFMYLPGCKVYTDLTFWYWTQTNAAGYAVFSAPIPGESKWTSQTFYNQWLVEDSRVNSVVGFAASDGVKITTGPKVGGKQLLMSLVSGAGGYADNSLGFFQPNQGYVFQAIY